MLAQNMILTVSAQHHIERTICPKIITKGFMPPEAILHLVKTLGHFSRILIREVFLISQHVKTRPLQS